MTYFRYFSRSMNNSYYEAPSLIGISRNDVEYFDLYLILFDFSPKDVTMLSSFDLPSSLVFKIYSSTLLSRINVTARIPYA